MTIVARGIACALDLAPAARVRRWLRFLRGLRVADATMAQEVILLANRPLRLDGARGRLIRCLSGCVWITAPRSGDIVLRGGESWVVPCSGRVLMEAVGAATISVQRS